MKQLFEFIPILLFFVTYKLYDIYIATMVVIAATFLQVSYSWLRYREVKAMQWITLGLMVTMGGATIYLHDEQFIKWKLTIIEWLFGISFLGSQFFGKKTFVERMMGASLKLPDFVWKRLNFMWAVFFIGVGTLNIYVMQKFNTEDWVTFKTFGVPGLMIVFIVLQMIFIYKYIPETEDK